MSWGDVAQERLTEIAKCSLDGPGVTRFPFSAEHRQALPLIRDWMERAGLSPQLDAAGTLVGRAGGEGPAVLIGSHQDSVRNGGRYDGIMGVALACLALEKLRADGKSPGFPVEVLAFADEEGVRFPTALLGPRAMAGTVDPAVMEMTDRIGVSLGDALKDFGGDPARITSLARRPEETRAYLEVHIEQGPILETMDQPVGIVTEICGIERNSIRFRGTTGHAGTVPMAGRADALVAAADFISFVHDQARETTDLRATVGTLGVTPNVANGIPELAELTLEIRAPKDDRRRVFFDRMDTEAKRIAARRGVGYTCKRTYEQVAVPCGTDLIARLTRAVAAIGQAPVTLTSGATHDASAMADLCDIGMLFVRCKDGLSHRPEEFAEAGDMGIAIDALAQTLLALGD